MKIKGRAWKYGDHVNTDVIFPGKYTYTISDPAEMGPHARMAPVAPGCEPSWHLAVALIEFNEIGMTRTRVVEELRDRGVGTQVHYVPVHLQPYYRQRYGALQLPGAERYYARCLSLPLYPSMKWADVDRVCDQLAEVLGLG